MFHSLTAQRLLALFALGWLLLNFPLLALWTAASPCSASAAAALFIGWAG
jgi:hypothetical protein